MFKKENDGFQLHSPNFPPNSFYSHSQRHKLETTTSNSIQHAPSPLYTWVFPSQAPGFWYLQVGEVIFQQRA